ncbi:DMT family transporter [Falsirhodobacter xinxiangensis]|uniref:DMT family transporter n=1 Tax=Falsirhodobacter xinxiangensis TaxID=2530049 RepID=UPI0010AB290D|nr:DMT family transporter [Rhodobacter xinxiangensis]
MDSQRSLSLRSWAELFLIALFWGGSFLANRLALDSVGVHAVVAARCLGACAILWVVVLARGYAVPRSPRIWVGFMVLGILNNVLPFSLITWAQLSVPSGLAAILNASTAIFGVLVAALVFGDERLSRRRLAGVLTGFVGVVIVIGPDVLHRLDLTSLAQIALLGAALSYAFAGAFGRIATRGIAPVVAAAGMLTFSAAISVPLMLWTEGLPVLPTPTAAAALAYLAAISTAAAYLLYYRLLSTAGAGNTSLVTLLVAPIAITLGALVLDETLPLRAFAGFAALGLGLLILDGRIFSRVRARAAR